MSEAELHILRARLDGGIRQRPPEANCAAVYQRALSGVRLMVRSCSIPTRRWSMRSAPSSNASPRPARHGGCGYGSARTTCYSRCRTRNRWVARCAGSCRPTMPSMASSSILATPAPIPMAAPISNGILTTRATCADVHAGYRATMGGPDPQSPSGLHRLGDIRGQPDADRYQYPSQASPGREPTKTLSVGQAGRTVREGARCCKGWPSVAIVAAGYASIIAAEMPARATIVLARTSSRDVANTVSTSAAAKSMRRSPMHS